MSVETTTADDSIDDEEDDYEWKVEQDGMMLAKVSYSTYKFGYHAFDVEFSQMRDYDDKDGITLRDGSRNDLGTLDPDDEDVPDNIAVAFTVLSHELC